MDIYLRKEQVVAYLTNSKKWHKPYVPFADGHISTWVSGPYRVDMPESDKWSTYSEKVLLIISRVEGESLSDVCFAIARKYPKGRVATRAHTDCRSTDGVTVGIIDGIITYARLIRNRDLNATAIKEALLDLGSDEDFKWLVDYTIQANG